MQEQINQKIRDLKISATLAINELSKKLLLEGKQIYKLGLGQSPFPVPKVVVKALQKHAHKKDYLPVQGLAELREAVAEFHKRRNQVGIKPENVIIGPGSKELMFLLQLAFDGEILIPSPAWVSYLPQAKIIGRKVKIINTSFENKWKIQASQLDNWDELSEAGEEKYKLLILNYPNNPSGLTYSANELEEIAKVARKNKILILSDEIYAEVNFTGSHNSIAKYYPQGTIISSGLSKWCGAGGWRLGTFAFPPELKWLLTAMSIIASETYTSVSAPIQYAAITAFNGGDEIEKYLLKSRLVLKELGEYCSRKLKDAEVKVHKPEGGFYLFLDFSNFTEMFTKRDIKNSEDLCTRLLEKTGVAIIPGNDFLVSKGYSARLAYVDFNGANALNSTDKVTEEFLHKYCKNVVEAIDKLIEFLE